MVSSHLGAMTYLAIGSWLHKGSTYGFNPKDWTLDWTLNQKGDWLSHGIYAIISPVVMFSGWLSL